MNRVFMIEQPDDVRRVKRLRMWVDLGAAGMLLVAWGTYFRMTLIV
jgi:hypothetical protein